jgi:hypothetical protein
MLAIDDTRSPTDDNCMARFPFPQSANPRFAYHESQKPDAAPAKPGCTTLDCAVIEYYEAWRRKFLQRITSTDAATIKPGKEHAFVNMSVGDEKAEKPFRSVSEGHGYGMLIAVLMAGHPRAENVPANRERGDFDALYRFFLAHSSVPDPDKPSEKHDHLMAFRVQGDKLADLTNPQADNESDSASDGDMDIAYALLLAERQWGNDTGELNYGGQAREVIAQIETYEVNHKAATVKLGDKFAGTDSFAVRTSDFMPQHWCAFANAGDSEHPDRPTLWKGIIEKSLAIEKAAFEKPRSTTGLMPDFLLLPEGAPPEPGMYKPPEHCFLEREHGDGNWSYNACRTPWRLATDYLVTGETSAREQLLTLNEFMPALAEREGGLTKLNAGYTLDGKGKLPDEPDGCAANSEGGKKGKPE